MSRSVVAMFAPIALTLVGCSSSTTTSSSDRLLDRSEPVTAKRVVAPNDPAMGKVRVRVLAGSSGEQDYLTNAAVRQMVNVLSQYPNFTVVDPENLGAIKREWELVDAGVTNPDQSKKAVGLSVPDYHIVCRVTQVEDDIEADRAATQWHIIIPFGVKREDHVGVVELVTDMVHPQTGETAASFRTAAAFSRSMKGSNVTVPGLTHSEESLSRVPATQAVRTAVESASSELFERLRSGTRESK